jgi:HK97 family phage portal protein
MSGFLSRLLAADPQPQPSLFDDFWWTNSLGSRTQAGFPISPDLALQVSTVFACVKVIAETIASLPLIVYERVSDTAKQRAVGTPEYKLLHRMPNGWQTPYDFKENLTAWAALHGGGFGFKIFAADGSVAEIDPIHPTKVKVEKLPSRQLRYQVLQPDGTWKPYVQGEIFHLRGFSVDGITGVQLTTQAREAIALARAMESFGSRYFANDTTIGLVLEHPGQLSTEAHKRLEESLRSFTGPNQWKGKILEEGMKLNRIQANAKEAQLLDGRLHQVIEICRFFRMPPHKIAHLLQATFSNIEHQGIEFVTDTIQPWAVRWEESLTRDIIVDDDRYFAEFLMTGLLRGDSAARSAYYRERFHIGTLSRNEIRALENENPIAGGDTYYVNAAVIPLDETGRPVPTPRVTAPGTAPVNAPASAPDPADGADDTEGASAAGPPLQRWIQDAADRIAAAEARELERRADKRAEDPVRFLAWAREWYAAHRSYALRTVAPVLAAYADASGTAPAADRVASLIVESGLKVVEETAAFDREAFAAMRRHVIANAITSECLFVSFSGVPAHA